MKNSFNIYQIKLGLLDSFVKSNWNLIWVIIAMQPTNIST